MSRLCWSNTTLKWLLFASNNVSWFTIWQKPCFATIALWSNSENWLVKHNAADAWIRSYSCVILCLMTLKEAHHFHNTTHWCNAKKHKSLHHNYCEPTLTQSLIIINTLSIRLLKIKVKIWIIYKLYIHKLYIHKQ